MDPTYFKKIAELRGYRKKAAEEAPKLESEPVQGVDYRSVEPTDEQKRSTARREALNDMYGAASKMNEGTFKWGVGSSAAAMALYAAIKKLRGKNIRPGGMIGSGIGGYVAGSMGKNIYNQNKNPQVVKDYLDAVNRFGDTFKKPEAPAANV